MKDKAYKLRDDVAAKYEITGTDQVHGFFPGWGEVDMRALTLDAAAAMVKAGFPYLKEKIKTKS